MNYIEEIHAFYDWLETNTMPPSCIVLWHALAYINHKAGSAPVFAVAISTLESRTGLTRKTIERSRNILQQKGLITWKSRNGNQSAVYTLKSLQDILYGKNDAQNVLQGKNVAQSVVQDVAHNVVQDVAQSVAIITEGLNDRRNDGLIDTREEDPWDVLRNEFTKQFRIAMNKTHYEMISSYLEDGMEIGVILLALEDAKANNATYPKYLWTVLANWFQRGVKTLSDYREYMHAQAEIKAGQQQSSTTIERGKSYGVDRKHPQNKYLQGDDAALVII